MVKRSLFPKGCKVIRTEGELSEREATERKYDLMLPELIDVLLFAVGSDAPIYSLFPQRNGFNEKTKFVVPIVCPTTPPERLTNTTSVIQSANSTFLFSL